MAKLSKGIFGPFSGKIGGVVGSTWKKTAYVRSAPRKKKKPKPRTPAQIANQQKFKFVTEWLVPFYPFIFNGFRNNASEKTEINAAFSLNYRRAVMGTYPDFSIDYTKVMLSVGNLPGLIWPRISSPEPGIISLEWERNNPYSNAVFDDQLMLVLYSPELKMIDGFIGGVKRADFGCQFTINKKLIGKVLEVYVSTYSLNGKTVSNSTYLGRITS